MGKFEEILDAAFESVKDDVAAQIKAHPDYASLIEHLAAQGVQQLVTMAAAAV